MKEISAAVKNLSLEELAQAASLYHKQWRENLEKRKNTFSEIPKPNTATTRKDGSLKALLYQTTRHDSFGETQIYLNRLNSHILEESYVKDTDTGKFMRIRKWLQNNF